MRAPSLELERVERDHGHIRWVIDCKYPNGSAAKLYVTTPTWSADVLSVSHDGITWSGFSVGWPFDDLDVESAVPRFIGRHLRLDANRRALDRARTAPQPRAFLFGRGWE